MIKRALGALVTGPLGFFVSGAIDVLAGLALGLAWAWRTRAGGPGRHQPNAGRYRPQRLSPRS